MGCAFTSAIQTRLCIICLFCNTFAVVVHVPDVVVVQLPAEQAIIPCNFTRPNPDTYYRIVWESRGQDVIRTDSSGKVYNGRRYPDANLPWNNCTLTLSHPWPQHAGDYWVTVMVSKEKIVHHKTTLMIKNEDKALPLSSPKNLVQPKLAIRRPDDVTEMWRHNDTTQSLDNESAVDAFEANATTKAGPEHSEDRVPNALPEYNNTGWILAVAVTAAAVVVILLLFIIVRKVYYRKRRGPFRCQNPNDRADDFGKGCPMTEKERNTDGSKNDNGAGSSLLTPYLDYSGSTQPLMETHGANAKGHVRDRPVISVTYNPKNGPRRWNAVEQKCINSIYHQDHGSSAADVA